MSSLFVVTLLLMTLRCGAITWHCWFLVTAFAGVMLIGAMAFAIFSESWRVDEMICGDYSNVHMETCDEGETSTGYRSLAWYVLAMGACALAGVLCMLPGARPGVYLSMQIAEILRCPLLICPVLGVLVGLGLYAYFLTLVVFTSSIGDARRELEEDVPTGEVRVWSFSTPERVLVFFLIGIALWLFNALAHMVEFVTARCVALFYINSSEAGTLRTLLYALHHMLRYRLGSVLFSAVLIPLFRLPRNLLYALKRGRKKRVFGAILNPVWKQYPCMKTMYHRWLKYMTSDGLAWEAIKGGTYISSAVHGHVLLKRHNRMRVMDYLNSANYSIWAYQLTVTMLGPVFTVYYAIYVVDTFRAIRNREISSIVALAFYMLAGSWMQAQVIGGFMRGVIHGCVMAFLIDIDMNPMTERVMGVKLLRFFRDDQGEVEQSPEDSMRDMQKVRPMSNVEEIIVPPVRDLRGLEIASRGRSVPPNSRQGEVTIGGLTVAPIDGNPPERQRETF